MRRLSHTHSFAAGVIGGLLLSYRPWIMFAAGILAALAALLAARAGRRLADVLGRLVLRRPLRRGTSRRSAEEPSAWEDRLLAEYERGREQGAIEAARLEGRRAAKREVATREDLSPRVIY